MRWKVKQTFWEGVWEDIISTLSVMHLQWHSSRQHLTQKWFLTWRRKTARPLCLLPASLVTLPWFFWRENRPAAQAKWLTCQWRISTFKIQNDLRIGSCHVDVSKRLSRSIGLAIYCLSIYFWLIRSLVDPTLAACFVRGPLAVLGVSGFS